MKRKRHEMKKKERIENIFKQFWAYIYSFEMKPDKSRDN